MLSLDHTRREFLKSSVGLAGLTLPTFLKARAGSSLVPNKAKSCIIIYTWGGEVKYSGMRKRSSTQMAAASLNIPS
ncbi:MAG: hypothetical protein HN675_15935 [Opitutae bacterium]|nr:hypothetical protein [Opitutae bacterium]MBT5381032.1 hypothetical protein [Opitutae bacterium]MBT5689955.1 hypothetical protein [Opitutae bacterium]MBT7854801.1 hypothetical protein [Opitutae bacterium]